MTFLAQVPFEVVGVLVLTMGVLMAIWSLAGIQEAYRSIGDGGLWLRPSRAAGQPRESDDGS